MDQITKKTGKNYVYGYDLYSNSVQKYASVNDIKTVKTAVMNNIHDYFEYLEVFETDSKWDRRKVLSYTSVLCSLIIALGLYTGKDVLKPHNWATFLLIGICVAFSGIASLCDYAQNAENVAFAGIIFPLPTGEGHKKECFRILKGRRVCVRVDEVPKSSKLNIEVQLVGPPRFFTRSEVYFSFSKEVPYGRYFGKDGFFYPPSLVEDVDMLLGALKTAIVRKRQ
ncbi:putative lipase domain protein [Trypanosoma theileri]|uniref:Putative lipase domain protein n=1 Tax=Trypanosoma theileri TaxID=67003 RepID=A0A1X0P325_9TRYP|nr:putative lipase domain protein [Trypanosoma theileri]ORC91218.1 putative lipase domain protein [Trypanosoma theileri]